MKSSIPVIYSLAFVVAAALGILMLVTDTNLQTNFGTAPKYFIHWYAVLAMVVADLIGVGLLLALRSRTAVKLGVIGSALLSVAMVAVVFTYQEVGFASMMQFANYLFGVTSYGGDIRYLYDVLLAVDIVTAVGGAVLLSLTRAADTSETASEHPRSPSN
ncbi:MAG: hypothetical protein WCA77_07185 [Thermoplasmata archaeon]